MKKSCILLILSMALSCFAGCAPKMEDTPAVPDAPKELVISGQGVDVRQTVVDYMMEMANVVWTAGARLDYREYYSSLLYTTGTTYIGMVYNRNWTGLESFLSILDEDNNHIGTETDWDLSPGNSCSTSIRHAWQLVSPEVEYGSCIDMVPVRPKNGVLGVGDIDWSTYNGVSTNSVLQAHDRQVIMEAYAQTKPGDALLRYIDSGGHALMITKEPEIVRNSSGAINMINSYLYLTDQNSRIHDRREYPSTWEVDKKVSFSQAFMDGYLPVTCAALQEGTAADATFELDNEPTEEDLAKGFFACTVKSNYCMNVVRLEILSGDEMVASAEKYPYTRSFSFKVLGDAAGLNNLPSGEYVLKLSAEVGIGSITLAQIPFSK